MSYHNNASRVIGEYLHATSKAKSKNHQSSGKISPSKLAYTTQAAILAALGVETDPFDDYVYGIFARGEDVEERVLRAYRQNQAVETQKVVNYRNAVGLADIITYGLPIEIKSVGQKKFWLLTKERRPQVAHAIQLCFYVVGLDRQKGLLDYVAADSLSALEIPIYGEYWRENLDYRLDAIYQSLLDRRLPDYLALEPTHKVKQYYPYKEFYKLKGVEAERILKEKYPGAYQKLKSGELISLCDKSQYKNLTRLRTERKKYLQTIQSQETATMSCGVRCVSCSIRRLNDLSTITATSRIYFMACRHKAILLEQGEK